MRIDFKKCLWLTVLGIVLTGSLTYGQSAKEIDWTRMQRDLDIMESVLDKLLATSSGTTLPDDFRVLAPGRARGLYFEGYGVILQTSANGRWVGGPEEFRDRFIEVDSRRREEEIRIKASSGKEGKNTFAERLENIKKGLLDFLNQYADAIGQLNENDRITVLVNLAGEGPFFYRVGTEETTPSLLEATTRKSDIIQFRKGAIDENEFHKRVIFREKHREEKRQKNIDIMANIMDTALSQKYHDRFGSRGNTRGIFLDNLGVIFFMKGEIGAAFRETQMHVILENLEKMQEKRDIVVTEDKQSELERKSSEEMVDEYKQALIEVLGDYGHTLRTLKPNEYVVIVVGFDNGLGFPGADLNQFVLKTQKSDLDAYNRGDISLARLQEKMNFQEY